MSTPETKHHETPSENIELAAAKTGIIDIIEILRFLHDDILDTYKDNDTKAQVILTLNGVFLGFLTSSLLLKPDDLSPILTHFGVDTWLLIVSLSLFLVCSIILAIVCLWSRNDRQEWFRKTEELFDEIKSHGFKYNRFLIKRTIDPHSFQITQLNKKFNESIMIKILSPDTASLRKNLRMKRRCVNIGFAFSGASLIILLLIGVSYLSHLLLKA